MLFISLDKVFEQRLLWMLWKVVICQDTTFLARKCHLNIKLLHTLPIKITLGEVHHALTGEETDHEAVENTDLIHSTKENHK